MILHALKDLLSLSLSLSLTHTHDTGFQTDNKAQHILAIHALNTHSQQEEWTLAPQLSVPVLPCPLHAACTAHL